MTQRKPNKAQRNYLKQQIEELKNQRATEMGKIVSWSVFGILLCFTLVAPYVAYGYIKKSIQKRKDLLEKINQG